MSDEVVRLAVVEKLAWVRRQREGFVRQPRQSPREMVSGESHWFLGRRYRLRVHEHDGPAHVAIRGIRMLDLFVRPGADADKRRAVLDDWYRVRLKEEAAPMLARWQRALGVRPRAWTVRKMKTKWGSCTVESARIALNLELAKQPLGAIEYIVVHELVHLIERKHSDRFTALMDRHLPDWRKRRTELQQSVLGSQEWSY